MGSSNILVELDKLSATQLELLLLTSYYNLFFKESETVLQNNNFEKKSLEYKQLIQAYKPETIQKINTLYNTYNKNYEDFYGLIYNYCHKNKNYKNLLMLI